MNDKWKGAFLALAIAVAIISGVTAVYFLMANYKEAPTSVTMSDLVQSGTADSGSEILTVEGENGEKVDLTISDIPLYKEYLDLQDDIGNEVERTQLEVLDLAGQERFILLKYNCGNKHCSTILVKERESGVVSVGLADGIFQDYKLSPNKDLLLARFGYSEGGQVVRHVLLAVDLVQMKVIPYESTELAEVFMHTPTWPIPDYEWIDNNQFWMASVDLQSSEAEFEAIQNWLASSERKIKKITISLNQKDRLGAYLTP
ncbi:hypothetical protein SAMN04487969_13959 [Paenibacillus algorifonticola]|uniref:Uncharacterized protein n=1 Tax=Paenibacillus algorifonticola TaxID=684063 RepID=A0A1I2IRH0_9BACL|nr:hypothetical protein [Paenibacillus algorifonticola]SFF44310.1 hypothetical protein SAMN04487969_13959 [Paenibacillus algorifonticola]